MQLTHLNTVKLEDEMQKTLLFFCKKAFSSSVRQATYIEEELLKTLRLEYNE